MIVTMLSPWTIASTVSCSSKEGRSDDVLFAQTVASPTLRSQRPCSIGSAAKPYRSLCDARPIDVKWQAIATVDPCDPNVAIADRHSVGSIRKAEKFAVLEADPEYGTSQSLLQRTPMRLSKNGRRPEFLLKSEACAKTSGGYSSALAVQVVSVAGLQALARPDRAMTRRRVCSDCAAPLKSLRAMVIVRAPKPAVFVFAYPDASNMM